VNLFICSISSYTSQKSLRNFPNEGQTEGIIILGYSEQIVTLLPQLSKLVPRVQLLALSEDFSTDKIKNIFQIAWSEYKMMDVNLIEMHDNGKWHSHLYDPFNNFVHSFEISQLNFEEIVEDQKKFMEKRFQTLNGYLLKVTILKKRNKF
jgi:hypothetical protein